MCGGYLRRQRSKILKASGCQTQRGTEHSTAGLRGPAPPQRKSWRGWQQQDGLPGPSEQQPALASGLSSLSSGTTRSIYSHITFLQPPSTPRPSMVRLCTSLGLSSMSPSLLNRLLLSLPHFSEKSQGEQPLTNSQFPRERSNRSALLIAYLPPAPTHDCTRIRAVLCAVH